MCGIAAIFGQRLPSSKKIKIMIDSILHRGPDHQGFYEDEQIQLGSCRLSIFDLTSKGNMPMKDFSSRYSIVFNGEIYNFKELKLKYKIITNSNSDTEVLIELFSKIGPDSFRELNGIFAFVIYDSKKKKIYCVRDRLGIKPLYYLFDKGCYYFCSEIKGIKALTENISINRNIVEFYLKNSIYDFSQETFFQGIKQVEQGSYFVFDLPDDTFNKHYFWNLESRVNQPNIDYLKKIFDRSLSLQQLSDTKVGLNVSNGIDSNILISRLDKINGGQKNILANSYYYDDEEFNHSKDIEAMSFFYKWKINLHKVSPSDVVENFEEVAFFQDEPFPGINTIAKHLLIKNKYQNDCKVILEGQGGDDIAAGYKYYFPFFIKDELKNMKIFSCISEIKNFLKIEKMSLSEFFKFYINSLGGYNNGGISADGTISNQKDIINFDTTSIDQKYKDEVLENCKNKSCLKNIIYRDLFYTKLPRILRSVDRASMAYSKEIRVPILDHNITEYFFGLNNAELIKNGSMRVHYRNLFNDNFSQLKKLLIKKNYVPDPQTKWLKNQLFSWMYDRISYSKFDLDGMINKKKLHRYLNNFKNNPNINNSNFIWKLLNLEILYRKNM